MADLILREWNGKRIRIREDRYVCLTDMATASGKLFKNWKKLESTKVYVDKLSGVVNIPNHDLIQSKQGGKDQGTWGHPKVALRFAQWCSDDFAIQVDCWIDELLSTGSVALQQDKKMYTIDMVLLRSPATWERMFSKSWIEQAEKITKWQWEWSCMGTFINDCVYSYLPTDIVSTLRDLNPKNEDGRGRVHKHHQFLHPEIREIVSKHLEVVEVLMSVSNGNMDFFKRLMIERFGRFKLSGEEDMPLFKAQTVFVIAS